ncbi:uncharacterized protein LOC127082306 [Lathyrus oleraceus]|uniref:uncharacterized protein LOC127082306 n=1 Tax=Pisum sativum TaxID=3888 RepID=UPI0021D12742|nr:uncharacterized protein LOC127082306 [Pisum sativum]
MSKEELQSSLKALEQTMKERNNDKEKADIALQARFNEKGRKDWFVKIYRAMKKEVKFVNDTTLMAEGISDVLIMRRDGGNSFIKDVLYILGIKCNFLSIGQLLEKGHKTHMENKGLGILDA